MRAIINSSPFIALGCINKINLLTELFSEVLIPQEVYNETVIIDEAKGRKIARRHGLNVVGSLGILVLAKDKGLISEIKGCIEEMEHYVIRIGSELKTQVLKMAGE